MVPREKEVESRKLKAKSKEEVFQIGQRRLFLLEGFEIVAKILDALADGGLVVVVQILKDGTPNGHLLGTVGGKARTETKGVEDVLIREFSVVAFGERGENQGHAC